MKIDKEKALSIGLGVLSVIGTVGGIFADKYKDKKYKEEITKDVLKELQNSNK